VSEYLTDEEQVERLKQWWKENGRSIIAGVVIGLGIFGSWQGWKAYEIRQAEQGAAAYDVFVAQARGGGLEQTLKAEAVLRDDYAGTVYADFAGFEAARQLVAGGRLEDAAERLARIHEKGSDAAIRGLAQIRLARIFMAQGALDAAEKILQGEALPAYAAEVSMLRGDLARLRGDAAAARAAYELALAQGGGDREWIDLMLQNLAGENAG
jgi:predicted negative regulator of RcsB-dependent stress response